MCIAVMPKAEAFMNRMIRMNGGAGGFRLKVSPGGCSGLSAEFSVETAPQPGDKVMELETVKLFVPEASFALLEGYTVDFADSAMETGFKFSSPHGGGCACASSSGAQIGGGHGMATVSVSSIGRRSN